MTTKERNELAERINSTPKTLYNWETSKPELIKLLLLGLQKEIELEQGLKNEEDFSKKLEELTKRMDIIEITSNTQDKK